MPHLEPAKMAVVERVVDVLCFPPTAKHVALPVARADIEALLFIALMGVEPTLRERLARRILDFEGAYG